MSKPQKTDCSVLFILTILVVLLITPATKAQQVAANPTPAHGAVDLEVAALEWDAGFGMVSHKVYLSADETIDEADFLGETDLTIHVVTLDPGVTYYWRVDEVDANGKVTGGEVWSFSTLPLEAHFPNPADGAKSQPLDAQLSWTPGKDAIMHSIHLGTDEEVMLEVSTMQIDSHYRTETLEPNTIYYWRVDEFAAAGTVTGPVWSFETRSGSPSVASSPSPQNGAFYMKPSIRVSWTAGSGAVSHNVYFGDNFNEVNEGTGETFKGVVGVSTYDPGPLELNTTYYWRVDEVDANGNITGGEVWSFVVPRPVDTDEVLIRNYTPVAWQAADVLWIRDTLPHNKIDDTIDQSDADTFDVVINYKRAVQQSDVDLLNGLSPQSEVQMRLKYISSIAVRGLTKEDITAISTDLDIAFIEQQFGFEPTLDISVPTICVTPGTGGCPTTVLAGIDGTGVNVVIMDTGVDNVIHKAFDPNSRHIGGYDAVLRYQDVGGIYPFYNDIIKKTYTDPTDDLGHGTHVASIALGQATTHTPRGVAPRAGLIDVKVLGPTTNCSTPEAWLIATDGLQTVYDKRNEWAVKVINMSFGQCNPDGPVISDGLDAFSQLVDLAEHMGIVVVAAAGNAGPSSGGLATPAAATRAITVAASNTLGTVDRSDDIIWDYSTSGRRSEDNDADKIDELKPEVTAPGTCVDQSPNNDDEDADTLAWTKMTSNVEAGRGIKIYVASSADIAPGDILSLIDVGSNSPSELIVATKSAGVGGTYFEADISFPHSKDTQVLENEGISAARRGETDKATRQAGTSMAAPHVAGLAALIMQSRKLHDINPASVKDWIISTAELPAGALVSYPEADATWNDRWGWGLVNASTAVNLTTDFSNRNCLTFPTQYETWFPMANSLDIHWTEPEAGQTGKVTADIRNAGPNSATNVFVHFGVHRLSPTPSAFYDIGTAIVDVPVDVDGHTEVSVDWTPQIAGNACLEVEIGYGLDTVFYDNKASHNIAFAQSPVQFVVGNTLAEEKSRIDLVGVLETPDTGWTFRIDPRFVILAADDGPTEIEAELYPPADALLGSQQTLHVAAIIERPGGPVVLGWIHVQASAHYGAP